MPNPGFSSYIGLNPVAQDGMRNLKVMPVAQTGGNVIDLTQDAAQANLRFVQSVYFDLADLPTNAVITLVHVPTGFRVRIKGGTQGWFPVSCNDGLQFALSYSNVPNGTVIPLWFANFPAPNFQWASV